MTIEAHIVADSVNPTGNRLTTWVLKYPRSIHSELLTHRAFSRNSASSRAIPVSTMIKRVKDEPFIPAHWTLNERGMVGTVELTNPADIASVTEHWLKARDACIKEAVWLTGQPAYPLHKQVVNRLLEPWMHIEIVLTATEYKNWFRLRDHKAAEPHIRDLAAMMRELYVESTPAPKVPLESGCTWAGDFRVADLTKAAWWHLPFIEQVGRVPFSASNLRDLIKESVAHAFWVSYLNEWKQDYTAEDVERVYQQVLSDPPHASPTEHVAVACNGQHRHGNLVGWCSWRQFVPNESGGDYAAT